MNYTVQPPLQAEDAVLLCSYRLLTIFKSCGSSSILYFLINLPTFVILGSPLILNTGPSISLYFIKSSCRFSAFYTYCGIYTSQNEYYSSPLLSAYKTQVRRHFLPPMPLPEKQGKEQSEPQPNKLHQEFFKNSYIGLCKSCDVIMISPLLSSFVFIRPTSFINTSLYLQLRFQAYY